MLRESLEERWLRMSQAESALLLEGKSRIAGVDEAGRGPLAGPVAAAACILAPDRPILGLNDSKKLSEAKRMTLFQQIKENAVAWKAVLISSAYIDQFGIQQAIYQAMLEAINGLSIKADFVLLDYVSFDLPWPQRKIVKGDLSCNAIAAASILAKVSRDLYMYDLDKQYPHYGFARHKGYGTALHDAAIRQYGLCPEHRRCFTGKFRNE